MLDPITSSISRFFNKNGGTILTFLSSAGVIGTAYLSGKAAIKANEELKNLKGATTLEKVKALIPIYAPPVAAGSATVACILGANGLNRRQQASMLAAGAIIERTFKKYKDKAEELLGDGVVDANNGDEHPDISTENRLFYYNYYVDGDHPEYGSYFESTPEKVLKAEMELNKRFILRGAVTLDDFFKLLNLKAEEGDNHLGWSKELGDEFYGYSWVDFEHYDAKLEDGLECTIISTPFPPTILD